MAFKLVVFSCLLAVAYGSVAPAAPVVQAAPLVAAAPSLYAARLEDLDNQYRYGYAVTDALTGDNKYANEERNGDFVVGEYGLDDSDGTRRTVKYVADPINGFNAVVSKEPLVAAAPVIAEPAVVPARIAAPLPRYTLAAAPAPVVAAAPVATSARFAVAPAAPVAPIAPVAPFARYAVAPAAARFAAPSIAYPSPYTAAYTPYAAYNPYATAAVSQYSTGPITYAQYPASVAAAYTAYSTAYPTTYAAGPVAAPVAPAKLINAAPVAAAGYRYP